MAPDIKFMRILETNKPTKKIDEQAPKSDSTYLEKENIYSPGFVRTREVRLRGSSWSKL